MGKKGMLKVPGYKERIERIKSGLNELGARYNKMIESHYPQTETDSEGMSTWESPRKVKMKFRELTPQQGYDKTIKKFNMLGGFGKYVRIYIDGEFVVIEF